MPRKKKNTTGEPKKPSGQEVMKQMKLQDCGLLEVIDRIKPIRQQMLQGNTRSTWLFGLLKTKQSKYKIGMVKIAGSVGKKTATFKSDYDLVVYVNFETLDDENSEKPMFKDVLDTFETALSNVPDLKICKQTPYTLAVNFGGIEFDIVPAVYFGPMTRTLRQRYRLQKENVMNEIYNTTTAKIWSSSLAEFAIDFVLGQVEIIKQTIILAKYWMQKIPIGYYVAGKTSIIEVVVVYANRKRRKKYLITCFRRFLRCMAQFEHLNIVLKGFYNGVPDHVPLDKLPRIMDPVNPYNNLAAGRGVDEATLSFMEGAKEMLTKLEMSKDNVQIQDLFLKM